MNPILFDNVATVVGSIIVIVMCFLARKLSKLMSFRNDFDAHVKKIESRVLNIEEKMKADMFEMKKAFESSIEKSNAFNEKLFNAKFEGLEKLLEQFINQIKSSPKQ